LIIKLKLKCIYLAHLINSPSRRGVLSWPPCHSPPHRRPYINPRLSRHLPTLRRKLRPLFFLYPISRAHCLHAIQYLSHACSLSPSADTVWIKSRNPSLKKMRRNRHQPHHLPHFHFHYSSETDLLSQVQGLDHSLQPDTRSILKTKYKNSYLTWYGARMANTWLASQIRSQLPMVCSSIPFFEISSSISCWNRGFEYTSSIVLLKEAAATSPSCHLALR